MKRYEGMFLFDSSAAREWSVIEQEVHRLCNRIGAELLVCLKFDERKLAYEIDRRKRGTYVLTYFEAPPERIVDLERDAGLSELVLRLLVLTADDISEEKLNELKVHPAETPLQPSTSDTRRRDEYGDRDDRGGRDRDRDRDRERRGGRDRDREGEGRQEDGGRSREREPAPAPAGRSEPESSATPEA